MTQVKPNEAGNANAADGSPFAAMLAATTPSAPQSATPSNDPANNSDRAPQTQKPQASNAQTPAAAPAAPAPKASGDAPKTGGKDDSAANDNDGAADGATGAQTADAQPQTAAPQPPMDPGILPAVQAQLAAQAQIMPAQPAQQNNAANDDQSGSEDVGAIGANSAATPAQLAANMTAGAPKTSSPAANKTSPGSAQNAAAQTEADQDVPFIDPPSGNPPSGTAAQASVLAAAGKGANSDSKFAASDTDKPALQAAAGAAAQSTASGAALLAANAGVQSAANDVTQVAANGTAGPATRNAAQPALNGAAQPAANPAAPDSTSSGSPSSGNQSSGNQMGQAFASPLASSTSAANANSPVAAAQTAIKSVSGADSKSGAAGTGSASGKAAPQTADAAPQLPQPALPSAAPNLAVMTDSGTVLPGQNANTPAVSTSVHVASLPQGATPDINGLAVDIAARSQSGARQFDIRLDPPELGRVDVRLSIDASGKTEAHMTADQPATLSLLQKDSTSLTQALRNAGLDVSDNGLNFSLRSQGGQQGQSDSGQGRRSSLAATQIIDAVQSPSTLSFTGNAGDGRLDISV